MADPTLADRLSLTKRDDETLQQFADRLLRLRDANRDAFDRLEQVNCELSFIHALSHSIMDTIERIHGLVGAGGAIPNTNLAHFTNRAITLLCLQQSQCDLADEGMTIAVRAWPL